jgi:hypothetical protein
MKKTYYLAGPMTGFANNNIPAFLETKKILEDKGFSIQLPWELEAVTDLGWEKVMPEDIKLIFKCQGMVLLPKWERSRGAKLEFATGLMQSLKYDFEFFQYVPELKTAFLYDAEEIAALWAENWAVYSKVSKIA